MPGTMKSVIKFSPSRVGSYLWWMARADGCLEVGDNYLFLHTHNNFFLKLMITAVAVCQHGVPRFIQRNCVFAAQNEYIYSESFASVVSTMILRDAKVFEAVESGFPRFQMTRFRNLTFARQRPSVSHKWLARQLASANVLDVSACLVLGY